MSFITNIFRKSKNSPPNIHALISKLKKDAKHHQEVGKPLKLADIEAFERKIGVNISPSYSLFLQEFGDGAYWLYGCQPLDATNNPFWLKDLQPNVPEMVPLESDYISIESLFCLMTEDSNGGSWCWITSQPSPDGEYPLAYYHSWEKKLFYKIASFPRWLNILIDNKSEVIRILDEDQDKLGLG